MKLVFKKHTKKFEFSLVFLITLFFIIGNSQFFNDFGNEDNVNFIYNKKPIFINQGPSNDTTAPIVTFVQPEINTSIISTLSYEIIVNITDENPPLFGNVTFQISNYTNFLFNASMDHDGGDLWSFTWNNISLYPNQAYKGYIIQVYAKDSSSNENLGMTEEFYILLNVRVSAPSILQVLIYLLVACFIIAAIVVFLNRNMLRKVSGKKAASSKGMYQK